MRKPTLMISVLAAMAMMAVTACVNGRSERRVEASDLKPGEQTQPAAQVKTFIPVDGTDLDSKREAAIKRARSASPQKPFWTAYTFDVRPGIAVDLHGTEVHGSMHSVDGTSVVFGTSASGMRIETRNLGVFALREANGNSITRMEIYNLERPREYSGYPVYWLGRAGNEESLSFLRSVADLGQLPLLTERATVAIALHDDPAVSGILKNYVRSSSNQKVRATSVFWLGQIGGESSFLADLVRNERESSSLRKRAAHAIGASRDKAALGILQSLYEAVADREVKRAVIHAVSDNENKNAAFDFLLKVAKTDPDREARKRAIHLLGETDQQSVTDELMKIYAGEADTDIKRQVLHALSEIKDPRAEAKLLEIARSGESSEVRRRAIHWLGEKDNERIVDELMKIYNSDKDLDIRRQIIHAFSEMNNPRAEDKLFEIARGGDSAEMRKQAVHRIGEKAGKRSLELLRETVGSDSAEVEVQKQAVRAIGERPKDEAIPLLISIARTHPNATVRKQAIRLLGESGDERAVEFFREVLTK